MFLYYVKMHDMLIIRYHKQQYTQAYINFDLEFSRVTVVVQ